MIFIGKFFSTKFSDTILQKVVILPFWISHGNARQINITWVQTKKLKDEDFIINWCFFFQSVIKTEKIKNPYERTLMENVHVVYCSESKLNAYFVRSFHFLLYFHPFEFSWEFPTQDEKVERRKRCLSNLTNVSH